MPHVPHTRGPSHQIGTEQGTCNRYQALCQGCWPTYEPFSWQCQAKKIHTHTLKVGLCYLKQAHIQAKIIQFGSLMIPCFKLNTIGQMKIDEAALRAELTQNLSNRQTLFLVVNNNSALIFPSLPMMQLKMPLLTMWKAKCGDAIPNMTSIKRFHSPEAQNNPTNSATAENLFTLIS